MKFHKLSLLRGFWNFVVVIILGFVLVRLYDVISLHMLFPGDLNLETPAVDAVQVLRDGGSLFARSTIESIPYRVQLYPTLYHKIVSVFPQSQNPFVTPRLFSLAFMLIWVSILCFYGKSNVGVLPRVTVMSLLLSYPPLSQNIAFARHDPLALLFSLLSVVVLNRGTSQSQGVSTRNVSSRFIIWASLFSVLSILSKQSSLAAPMAICVFLFFVNLGTLRKYLTWLTVGVFVGLWILVFRESGVKEGVFSIVSLNDVGVSFQNFVSVWFFSLKSLVFVTILITPLIFYFFGKENEEQRTKVRFSEVSLLGWYAVFAWLILFLTVAKLGSSSNYFFEPLGATVLWALSKFESHRQWLQQKVLYIWILVIGVVIGFDHLNLGSSAYSFVDNAREVRYPPYLSQLKNEIEEIALTQKLQYSNMKLMFAPYLQTEALALGVPVFVNDTFAYSVLVSSGVLKANLLAKALFERQPDVVVWPLEKEIGQSYTWSHFEPPIHEALLKNYTLHRRGLFQYWTRAGVDR